MPTNCCPTSPLFSSQRAQVPERTEGQGHLRKAHLGFTEQAPQLQHTQLSVCRCKSLLLLQQKVTEELLSVGIAPQLSPVQQNRAYKPASTTCCLNVLYRDPHNGPLSHPDTPKLRKRTTNTWTEPQSGTAWAGTEPWDCALIAWVHKRGAGTTKPPKNWSPWRCHGEAPEAERSPRGLAGDPGAGPGYHGRSGRSLGAPRWGGGGRRSPEAKPRERGIGGGGSRAGAAPRRSSITCLWRRGPSQGFPERLGEGGLCLGPPRRPGQVRAAPPSRPEPRRAARPGTGPSPTAAGPGRAGPSRAGRDTARLRCWRSPEQPPRCFGGDLGRRFEARY